LKIVEYEFWVEHFELTRPYTIAFRSADSVDTVMVRIKTGEGLEGVGAASPEPFVTGETLERCCEACAEAEEGIRNRDLREFRKVCRALARRFPDAPAARAAVDTALHDAYAKAQGVPLADLLGRCHEELPTSVTIGIKPASETVEEGLEYVDLGFTVLKVKGGHSVGEDIERLKLLRDAVGPDITIRVDPNQGYRYEDVLTFFEKTRNLGIEFLEQPLPAERVEELRRFPEEIREKTAADESLHSARDAIRLLAPSRACGVFNIKLMKCGGIFEALRIAVVAEAAGIRLMWGCMDESVISIAGALHAAFASPATRYLDLDGSFDLARDAATGGFILDRGRLRTVAEPGLGVTLISGPGSTGQ